MQVVDVLFCFLENWDVKKGPTSGYNNFGSSLLPLGRIDDYV